MKKYAKWLIPAAALVLILLLVFVVLPAVQSGGGKCGTGLNWTMDAGSGVLTISGSGTMRNYDSESPWDRNRNNIKSVVVGDGVQSIGRGAFSGCGKLSSVSLPDGLQSIGEAAFSGCSSLTSISVPDSVKSIGDSAFYNCSSLSDISLGRGVTDIGIWAFGGCGSLKTLTLPDSLQYIGDFSFDGCASLNGISLGSGLTDIGDYAFRGCSRLESVRFPDGVRSIGSSAFSGCDSLSSVSLPDSLERIGVWAFGGCGNLKKVEIESTEGFRSISFGGDNANPAGCSHAILLNGEPLEKLTIPEGTTELTDTAFAGVESIRLLAVPASLTAIAEGVFAGCRNIDTIYYAGGEEEWKRIEIGSGNGSLSSAAVFFHTGADDRFCGIVCGACVGGTVSADTDICREGEVVTVSAVPDRDYRLKHILVDGSPIDGDRFTASADHTVTAEFEFLAGGTAELRINDIELRSGTGERLETIPEGKCFAAVSVENRSAKESATVMLACYSDLGQYCGLLWLTVSSLPTGSEVELVFPIDNNEGDITMLKAFLVDSPEDPTPVGNAVSFGSAS